jgi:hypothetical protein
MIKTSVLSTETMLRKQRISQHFLVNGKPLLQQLEFLIGRKNGDFLGCFITGFDEFNKTKKHELLLKQKSELPSCRVPIYVCGECADVGCGAYCVTVVKQDDYYIWQDFVFENGMDDYLVAVPRLGPFYFTRDNYVSIIQSAAG